MAPVASSTEALRPVPPMSIGQGEGVARLGLGRVGLRVADGAGVRRRRGCGSGLMAHLR